MNPEKPFGLYLYKKEADSGRVLKELLQFVRSHSPSKSNSFSFIEAENSLHPHLTLWENLQVELGFDHWKDFQQSLMPEWKALLNLITNPEICAQEAQPWEKFLVSLLKGLNTPSHHLLIDMKEDMLSPFMIQQFKKAVLTATQVKSVYLASAHTSLWLDCAHSIVGRKEFKFEIESLNPGDLKIKWAI